MPNAPFKAKNSIIQNIPYIYMSTLLSSCSSLPFRLRVGIAANLVNEINNHVVLLDADAIEVFSHSECEVVFTLSASLTAADHGRRVDTDPSRLRQDPLVVWVREGGRCIQAVLAAVSVKDGSFERVPLNLFEEALVTMFSFGRTSNGREASWRE